MKRGFSIVVDEDSITLPPMFARELKKLEEKITTSEDDGLRCRWEFGVRVLKLRRGTKLPKGQLEVLIEETGVARIEIQRRMRFAERYPTEKVLCHAVTQYGSWHQIVAKGLSYKPVKATTKSLATRFLRFKSVLAESASKKLTETERKLLGEIAAQIEGLLITHQREMTA